jgi:hypothetical protein
MRRNTSPSVRRTAARRKSYSGFRKPIAGGSAMLGFLAAIFVLYLTGNWMLPL